VTRRQDKFYCQRISVMQQDERDARMSAPVTDRISRCAQ